MNQDIIQRYAVDPMSFWLDLIIDGRRFGDIAIPEQIEWLDQIKPAVLALARGDVAPIRRFLLEATKGFAKTTLLTMVSSWLIVFAPAPNALLIVILARDFDQGAELIKVAKELLRGNPWIEDRFEVQRDKIVNPVTETVAEVWTRDNLGQHGGRPHLTIVDEYTHIDDPDLINTALDNATKRAGVVILSGNAGFLDTPAYRLRELYRTSENYSFFQFSRPAPWQKAADLREAELRDGRERYRRLFWGEWSSGTGDALTAEDLNQAFQYQARPATHRHENAACVVIGVDIGIRRDASGVCAVAWHPSENLFHLYDAKSFHPTPGHSVDLNEVEAAILEMGWRLEASSVWADPWQCEQMLGNFARLGIATNRVSFAGAAASRMAALTVSTFKEQRLRLYCEPELRKGLEQLRIVDRPYGMKIEAPRRTDDGHADLAFAFLCALLGCCEFASADEPPGISVPVLDFDTPQQIRALQNGFIY